MKPDFTKSPDGLIPVIVQDLKTNIVLMLGYMNEESFQRTIIEKRVTFYSRSKKRLWTKGEESGNYLNVGSVLLDCDADTLLIKAEPTGPICHTGSETCFKEENSGDIFLFDLEKVIQDRKRNPLKDSYVSSLFEKGINKIAQKVGEEAVELVIEAKDNNRELFKNEAADLMFHFMVLLAEKAVSFQEINDTLRSRSKEEKNTGKSGNECLISG